VTIATQSCEIEATAPGFEPARAAPPADIGPQYCAQAIELRLMSTALLTDAKLRRTVDVIVYDAKTRRPLSGVAGASVLYYFGSGRPRLTMPKLTNARGRVRIEAYVRLNLDSNLWWQPMDRIDLAASKLGYEDEIDTVIEAAATRPTRPLEAEIEMGRR
jgi:hypothetical protein